MNNTDYQAGTQKIDGFWGNLKQRLGGLRGVRHEDLPSHIREYQWRVMEESVCLASVSKALCHLEEHNKLVL